MCNEIYRERNELAAALAKQFPSWVGMDKDEPDWPVLYIELPTGQISYHFSMDNIDLLEHILVGVTPWDGHTNKQKSERLSELRNTNV